MVHLPIAIRAYSEGPKKSSKRRKRKQPVDNGWPRDVLILDTETLTDRTMRLTFGSARYSKWSKDGRRLECHEECIFHADDLHKTDPEGFACLKEYVRTHAADVLRGVPKKIRLVGRAQFVHEALWQMGYRTRTLIVGFNLSFDLSRLALKAGAARNENRGAYSLVFWENRKGKSKSQRPNQFRPRIIIRHIDSKKAFIHFGRPNDVDPEDQRPIDGAPPDPKFSFRGRFLDLRTLAFALTSRGYTLESACKTFGVEHPKKQAERHGEIYPEYIDYNRRDVLATQELLEKLRFEFDQHPIDLDPCKAYSAASMVKAYFKRFGLTPPMEQFSRFSKKILGQTMTAFYGGRAEVRIRKTAVPIVYTDFLSMYPTIQTLMELWDILSAEKLQVVDATKEFQALLDRISPDELLRPETWQEFRGFAQLVPDGDVLPCRGRYRGTEWNVGVNHLHSDKPLWYAIPDLVASKMLSGKAPQILKAFRLVPHGQQIGLRTIRLGGTVEVDPTRQNFFKTIIEVRKRIQNDTRLSPDARNRIGQFLKILANAGSYGIFVEMNRKQLPIGESEPVSIYGIDDPFTCNSNGPEEPGNYCFPPVASLITAGARLMLALLERMVRDQRGTYAFVDTDSMAIVATESGGLVACEGGDCRLPDGRRAVRPLSWASVNSIVNRLESLNPYDSEAVPGSILKIEDNNFDPESGLQRQLYVYAISAKRYTPFVIDSNGHPQVVDGYSEHGLGQYMNPIDPDSEDRDWIRSIWQGILDEEFGGKRFEPNWIDHPTVMQTSASSPDILSRFDRINRNQSFAKQVKPFNFLSSIGVDSFEWPPNSIKSGGFNLIAPYTSNPLEWLRIKWIDLHSGREYRIKTKGSSNRSGIRVQTFADVLERFRSHPESKSADSRGNMSTSNSIGLLGRLNIQVLTISCIGKETNLLEQQEKGVLTADPQAVYSTINELETIRKWLHRVQIAEVAEISGVSERMLRGIRQGKSNPSKASMEGILRALTALISDS